jgi:FKBP-type peptidyl-prolyl cis-trans isomerase FkpA
MRRLIASLLCLFPLAAAGCDSATEPRIEDTRFASHLGVDLAASTRLPSGLYYRDLTVGQGAVAEGGRQLAVHYRGWLSGGTLFEQLQPPSAPFSFTLGARQVIVGWDQGVAGMRVGGVRQLIIPPSLAYGATGQGPIPGNAILVFEVSLVAVQ